MDGKKEKKETHQNANGNYVVKSWTIRIFGGFFRFFGGGTASRAIFVIELYHFYNKREFSWFSSSSFIPKLSGHLLCASCCISARDTEGHTDTAPFLRSLSLPGETDTRNHRLELDVTGLGGRADTEPWGAAETRQQVLPGQPRAHRLPSCLLVPPRGPILRGNN